MVSDWTDLARHGKTLVERYKTLQGAESEIKERVILIQSRWQSSQLQLELLTRLWNTLDPEHQELQERVVQVLAGKLRVALSQIDKVERINPGDNVHAGVKRWKYMLYVKDSLDKAIAELEAWHKIFDPTWFLIMKIADPLVDSKLTEVSQGADPGSKHKATTSTFSSASHIRDIQKSEPESDKVHIFLPDNGLTDERIQIPFSTTTLAKRSNSNKWVILDSQQCDQDTDTNLQTSNVRSLARKLRHADPHAFNLLACLGVIKVLRPDGKKVLSFDYVFRIPDGMRRPRSLRGLILSSSASDRNHSLSDRFRIARQLAKSVSYIHMYDFVHKNIRPETVLVLDDERAGLGSLFLVGFKAIRKVDGKTIRAGDGAWERNFYRHPQRQGLHPDQDYMMQHDIYSLGVCLLEIGLWESFLDYQNDETKEHANPSPVLTHPTLRENADFRHPSAIKNSLVALARDALPLKMGEKYAEVVVTCLTCLDEDNVSFGDESEFVDEDGILVGVRYIEKVSVFQDGNNH